jgi:glucose uptake protein
MILPHSNATLILLMILCVLCWGSWPVLHKITKKYRFELFYFDFGFGLLIFTLICVFSFGSLGFDGFTFRDDFLNARKQEWLYAFLAAMIFNFGNMLLLAAVSVAGMTVAFPLAFGAALIVSSWMNYLSHPGLSTMAMLVGTVLILAAMLFISSAYAHLRVLQHEGLARAGKAKSTRRPTSIKGVLLATIGGVVMGSFTPLLTRAQDPDVGLGPYSVLFLFSLAVLVSTFVFNLFFMNLPVEGDPLEISDYFKTGVMNHVWGAMAGIVWGLGAIASFAAWTPKGDSHLEPPLGIILSNGAPLLAAVLGLAVFKEFRTGDTRVKGLAVVMLVLFACGIVFFSYAPLWAQRSS